MAKVRQKCDESAEFIERFRSGDPEAFDAFCAVYKPIVNNAIKGKCRRSEIDDITQDVFLKIFKVKFTYDSTKSKLKTWVCRIARSVAIDNYRFSKRRRAEQFDGEAITAQEKVSPSVDFSAKLFRGLSSDDIEILRLKYAEGLKIRQVAVSLGMPIGSVKSRNNRIIAKVRENHQNA